MSKHYILKGKEVVPCDLMTWAKWLETNSRRVAFTKFGNISVSTVFLGLNHRYDGSDPPLIFETIIFGGRHDQYQYQTRCSTWEEAEAMHQVAISKVRRKGGPG